MQTFLSGNPMEPPTAKGKLCFEDAATGYPIKLLQNGKGRFTVQYGLQVDSELSYSEAAAKLGQAIMHALACESKLDNRLKGER